MEIPAITATARTAAMSFPSGNGFFDSVDFFSVISGSVGVWLTIGGVIADCTVGADFCGFAVGADCTGGTARFDSVGADTSACFGAGCCGFLRSGKAVRSDLRSTNFAFSGGYGAFCVLQTNTSVTRASFSA